MKSVVFLCYSYGLLALLDFLGTLLFLYNISRDSAPYEACFHTYFGIYWIFTASSKIVQQMHVKTALFLGLFSDILSKVQLFVLRCAKSRLSARSLPLRLDFFAESVKSPIFASYAGNKKTMIVITIAFVSGIPAVHMPESSNAEMSHVHHAQGSLISVVCRSSDLSIHAQRILSFTQTHCFSLLAEP